MGNLLIVESKNDKVFIEKLVEVMNLDQIKLDKPIYIDDYECLEGLDERKLVNALKSLSNSVKKRAIGKAGIILDQDNFTEAQRLEFVDRCVSQVFQKNDRLDKVGHLIPVETDTHIPLQLGCYFTQMNQQGELETVLRAIKTQDSPYADCLENWRECLKKYNQDMSNKDFDKFWFSIYLRYDTCSKEERKQAGRKCSMSALEYVLREKSHILDFDHPILEGWKSFLRLFAD